MRRAKSGGLCACCGIESDVGLYWESACIVMDSGIPGAAPIEPDMRLPPLCDRCETIHRLYAMYTQWPAGARAVYGADDAAGALRMLGLRHANVRVPDQGE